MIILTAVFFASLILVFFLFRKKLVLLLWVLLIMLIIFFGFRIVKGYFPISVGTYHLLHLLIPPKDLLDPIITDNFLFHEKGFSKTYILKPKYFDFYDCGFVSEDEIPLDYRFNGKIKFEFYLEGTKIFEEISTQAKSFTKNKVSLIHFEMPQYGKYGKNINLKITVLEPDLYLKNENAQLYVAVSGIP